MLIGPMLAFVVIVLFGKRMRYGGAEVAIAVMAFNLLWSTALLLLNMGDEGVLYERSWRSPRWAGAWCSSWAG